MRIFDTHLHLDHLGSHPQQLENVAEGVAEGLAAVLAPAVCPGAWSEVLASTDALRHALPSLSVGAAVGIHPHCLAEMDDRAVDRALDELPRVAVAAGVSAIGEIGLDFKRERQAEGRARQRRVFARQLKVARVLDLPVVLHVLGGQRVLMDVVEEVGFPSAGAVLHSFSGSAELVAELRSVNPYFAFGASVGRVGARRGPAACRAVPADRLLVETDAPYQSPWRERPCRAVDIAWVLEAVATVRGSTPEAIAELTWDNAHRVFNRGRTGSLGANKMKPYTAAGSSRDRAKGDR